MKIPNNQTLDELKVLTETEPLWRRIIAIMLLFIIEIPLISFGAFLGIYFIEIVSGISVNSVADIAQKNTDIIHDISAIVFIIIFSVVGIYLWRIIVLSTKLISKHMVIRIIKYGPR